MENRFTRLLVLLFLLALSLEDVVMHVEARTCHSRSVKFKGLCVKFGSSKNCASICESEGFETGKCGRLRCICSRQCGPGGNPPKTPPKTPPSPPILPPPPPPPTPKPTPPPPSPPTPKPTPPPPSPSPPPPTPIPTPSPTPPPPPPTHTPSPKCPPPPCSSRHKIPC